MDYSNSKETLSLYKLIILYILDHVTFPMTQGQVCDMILEKNYTNYINLQLALSELTDTFLIQSKNSSHNRTQLIITDEGKRTLGFFKNRISEDIRTEIKEYLKENGLELRDEVSVLSNYYKSVNGEYEVALCAKEKDTVLIDLKLSVPTPQLASTICDNWQRNNQEIYQYLTKKLF
ncbi:MAG: DUF4364 family protein [Lachnospiraceae bacterium]